MTKKEIIEKLYTGKNFNDCLRKIEPGYLREDLKQEVILIICELPEEKLLKLFNAQPNGRELEFFTVRVILNQIKSNSSPFARKYRNMVMSYMEIDDKESEQFDREERELKETIEDMAVEEVDRQHWYAKGLIQLYLKHGNFRAIQDETGIPFGSCYKTIRKSFDQIKETIKPVFTKEELRFIQNGNNK